MVWFLGQLLAALWLSQYPDGSGGLYPVRRSDRIGAGWPAPVGWIAGQATGMPRTLDTGCSVALHTGCIRRRGALDDDDICLSGPVDVPRYQCDQQFAGSWSGA